MYQVRVAPDGSALEAVFSGQLPVNEVLRAISQSFALAAAGGITRALCDLRDVASGPALEALAPIAASLRGRLFGDQRVALVCEAQQVALTRRFARSAGLGTELGVFSREEDARAWLLGKPAKRLSPTAVRHLKPAAPMKTEATPPTPRVKRTA